MYVKLANTLHRTRDSLHSACLLLGIDSESLDPKLMQIYSCDNCGFWEKPTQMVEEDDGTLYCHICDEAQNYRF